MGKTLDTETPAPDIEIALLLEAIYAHHGYDFRQYSRTSITRRVFHFMAKQGISNIADIQLRIRNDHTFCNLLICELSVTVTEMFRQPSMFRVLRETLLPTWQHKPIIKIWSAGCATGEEVYSLAILLHEAGLLKRTQLYATDINPVALENAAKGMMSVDKIQQYTRNYHASGGQNDFCNYYAVLHNKAFMEPFLTKQIRFTHHNLVHDQAFAQMDLILCRNVLIYFTPALQQHVVGVFKQSLGCGGVLCIGNKESLYLSDYEQQFSILNRTEKFYQINAL